VSQPADSIDLGSLRLTAGEGRRFDLDVGFEPFELGGERYLVEPSRVPVRLDVSRTLSSGYALRIRFTAALVGPCMRCLEPGGPEIEVDAREVDQPGGGEDLRSPYVLDQVLDLRAWAREALALARPDQVLCRPDCAGLCAECGANLNTAGPEHQHAREPDARWAKLRELKLD